MSQSELMEWVEYLNLYPLLEDRNEVQMAVLTQSVLAPNTKQKISYKDFMLTADKEDLSALTGKDLENYIQKVMG